MKYKRSKSSLNVLVIAALLVLSFTVAPAEAYVEDPLFTIHFSINAESDSELKLATSVKEEMAKIGVEIIVEAVEGETLTSIQYSEEGFKTFEDGGWDMDTTQYWWWPPDWVWVESVFSGAGEIPAGANINHWHNDEADSHLRAGLSSFDDATREENLLKWQEIFMDDVPYVLLCWPDMFQLARKEVKGPDSVMWTHNIQQWTVEGKTAEDWVTIRYAYLWDPTMLNPWFLDGGWAHLEPMFRPLFHVVATPDGGYNYGNAMAESFEMTPDGNAMDVHLRQGVTWHDGEKFTADDVKFTLDMILNPDTGAAAYGDLVGSIESVEILDEYTVRLHLLVPSPILLSTLTGGTTMIMPEHVLGEVPAAEMRTHESNTVAPAPGTGPYQFVEWIPDQYMKMEAFDDYFEGRVFVDEFIIPIVSESSVALAALEVGEVDVLHPVLSDDLIDEIPRIQAEVPEVEAVGYKVAVNLLGFNLKHPILSDVNVRKAFAYATNYDHIINDFFDGNAEQANSILPPGWLYRHSTLQPYSYDLEKAADHLAMAGYEAVPELPFNAEVLGLFIVSVTIISLGARRKKLE